MSSAWLWLAAAALAGKYKDDKDRDGILGAADHCPDEPEDADTVLPGDGCPGDDEDHDGVPDAADKCPEVPEDADSWQDDDGCPDPLTHVVVSVVDGAGNPIPYARATLSGPEADLAATGGYEGDITPGTWVINARAPTWEPAILPFEVAAGGPVRATVALVPSEGVGMTVTATAISLDGGVKFDAGRATLPRTTRAGLDHVAALLADWPEIEVVRVSVADPRGGLATQRAAAVVAYLVAHGVAAERLATDAKTDAKPAVELVIARWTP